MMSCTKKISCCTGTTSFMPMNFIVLCLCSYNLQHITDTVEPPNNGHVWDPLFSGHFVLC